MFVTVGEGSQMMVTPSPTARRSRLVLIEIQQASDVDNGVVIAVLQHVLSSNFLRLSRHGSSGPSVAVVAIDHPPEAFCTLRSTLSLPASSVVDAFSQWYPSESNNSDETPSSLVHIADSSQPAIATTLTQAVSESLLKLEPSEHAERVIVLDSLTSFLHYHSGLPSVLKLLSALSSEISSSVTTIVSVIRTDESGETTCATLRTLADTHVRVHQPSSADNGARTAVHLDIRRRKPSGRVAFEVIKSRMDFRAEKLVDVEVSARASEDMKKEDLSEIKSERDMQLAERGLTFRISLSSTEREMRAAAGLPYLHHDEQLADSALELHPKSLQVDANGQSLHEESDSDLDEDGEELFSEDV